MWLVHVFGTHEESFECLQQFLQTPDEHMKDLYFLAIYVCGPVNKLTDLVYEATLVELEQQGLMLRRGGRKVSKQNSVDRCRLEHYIRVSYGMEYLRFLARKRMTFKFRSESVNNVLLTWMAEGDLGYSENSKNMLRTEKALCYDNVTKLILMGFPKYVEGLLRKTTKLKTHQVISLWWRQPNKEGLDVIQIAKNIFPSFRTIDEDKNRYKAHLGEDQDYLHSIVPSSLRLSDKNQGLIRSGEIDLSKYLKPTEFMSPKLQTEWIKEKGEDVAAGEISDEVTKRVIMDTFDETAMRLQRSIRAEQMHFTQSSDDSSKDTSDDEEGSAGDRSTESPKKLFAPGQLDKFATICKNISEFTRKSPAKTSGQSKKFQGLMKDYVDYTKQIVRKLKYIDPEEVYHEETEGSDSDSSDGSNTDKDSKHPEGEDASDSTYGDGDGQGNEDDEVDKDTKNKQKRKTPTRSSSKTDKNAKQSRKSDKDEKTGKSPKRKKSGKGK